MITLKNTKNDSPGGQQQSELYADTFRENNTAEAFKELERGLHAALETYSNVHRGSGHNSMVSTSLFEQARAIVLEYLGLSKGKFVVIFCTSRRAELLKAQLKPKSYQCISSQDIGLPLGVRALAVDKKELPKGAPDQAGGGTAKLISKDWVIWTDAPDKFEAGTPAIINIIAFAKALLLIRQYGKDIFRNPATESLSALKILYHDELTAYSGRILLDVLKKTLIGRDILVPTAHGLRPFINLDNGASTPTFTPIWKVVCQAWRQPKQIKQEIIHEVKSICAGVLGAPPTDYDVIFTSNTTEAINFTAEILSHEFEPGIETVVLNTLLEHNSNDLPWRIIPQFSLIRLSADDKGFLDLDELDKLLRTYNLEGQYGKKRIKLVAVSGASNVLGTFNDLAEISRIVHRYGACLLVDAAQLVAHRKVEMEVYGIDYLAFSAHKVYAPFGCGILVVRKGLLNFSSAEMELILSSGEENVGGIAALGKALVLLQRIGMDLIREEEQALTQRALRGMSLVHGLRVYGIDDPDSPGFDRKGGVIVFSLKDLQSNIVAKELAMHGGIGVQSGCHCAHIIIKSLLHISPFLERLQRLIQTLFPHLRLPSLVRVSLGIENNEKDVDRLLEILGIISKKARASSDIKKQMNDFVKASSLRVYSLNRIS